MLDRLASGDREPARGEAFPLADVTLLAPVPRPRAIFGIGLNYRAHAEEGAAACPRPDRLHEAADVVGGARRAGAAARRSCGGSTTRASSPSCMGAGGEVAGYAVADDVIGARPAEARAAVDAREGRRRLLPVGAVDHDRRRGARPDDLRAPHVGQRRAAPGRATSDLIFDVAAIVAFIAETITLEPGDLILTGTPSGVGACRTRRSSWAATSCASRSSGSASSSTP